MKSQEILSESIADLSKNNFDDALIKDNKICFIYGETMYRVRMPNQGEQSLAEHKRNLMQLDYLKQEGCITRKQLIQQLKTSNVVDIEKLEDTREELSKELKKYWFMLATKDSQDKTRITEHSEKITLIQGLLQNLAIDISKYLNPCLESRLENFYIEFLTTICTEQKVGEDWKRVWNSYEDFNNADSSLTNKAISSISWLLLNRR